MAIVAWQPTFIPQVQANGATTIYRGFANHGDDFLYSRWSSAEFEELKNLGFNLIMPTFWWNDFENSDGSYDNTNINAANATVNTAISEGLSVIISFRVAYNNSGTGYWTWGNGYPTHDYVNLNQAGGGENGRTRYADFLGDMAQKFPQVDGFCLWHFPYHQTSCSASSRTTYYDTTFPALLAAVRVHFSGDVVFVPIHQGTEDNGENSNPYKAGEEVETEIDGGKYGDSSLIYGLGHMAPYSVIAGGEWDYDYAEMEDAFDGIAYYTSTYNVPMISVEYCPLVWNGYALTASRLACLESSLQFMYAYDVSWAYWRISQAHTGADDILIPTESFELNHDLRDLLVKYLPPSIGFQSWQNGFEEGDFSAWNGTQTSNGEATVTSTYSYQGVYSANFTADGSVGSYARSMLIIQPVTEVYVRSFVRFEDLPDTDGSRINMLRIAQVDGTWITIASVNRTGGNYYWQIRENSGSASDTQLDNINADQLYEVEMYSNATDNGNATLWINKTKLCEVTGDFSGVGNIARVYPYIYCGGTNPQASAKTVYHDSFIVDNERIGSGTPQIFQSLSFSVSGDEGQIEGVKINGTYTTDSSGYYEWANLTYGINTFIVEKPDSYYPAWCLHVDGGFSWNTTHYILQHNVTENQEELIQIYFYDSEDRYVYNASAMISTLSFFTNYLYFTVDRNAGTSTTYVNATSRGNATAISGASAWSYTAASKLLEINASHTSIKELMITWSFWNTSALDDYNAALQTDGKPYITTSDGLVVALSNATTTFSFNVTAGSGLTTTTQVNAVGKYKPDIYKITGATDWFWNGLTDVITIYFLHTSEESVTIYWY